MEEKVGSSQHPPNKPEGKFESLPSVGQIIAKKRIRPAAPAPKKESAPVARPTRPITYPFVPFPTELASLEKRQVYPPAHFRVLALRRFAQPVTGEWITSTEEVARLIRSDRSTAQKSLRELEHAHFIHLRHLRSSTVQLQIYFGGFAQPGYRSEGLAPLRWDADFTADPSRRAPSNPQRRGPAHSAQHPESGSAEHQYEVESEALGTAPRTKNEDTTIRLDDFSTSSPVDNKGMLPVMGFVPQINDESIVQELARKLGEKYMNNFLSMRRRYGLNRLEKACVLALEKLRDVKHPFRKRPGAYVQWLLVNGIC